MVLEDLRNSIGEINENAVIFDNPSFDNSIIGISCDGHIIYSLKNMIKEICEEENITEDDAYEFIESNTIRILPYINEFTRPVILDDLNELFRGV